MLFLVGYNPSMRILFIGLFVTLISHFTTAQQAVPVIKHYGSEHGLPSSEVYMALQDSKGFLWFATDRGVARYNGYEFKVFTSKDGLCDNSVLGLYEDYKGRIWFFTYSNQLSYFDNGTIHNCIANEALKDIDGFHIPCSMLLTEQDEIILGFKNSWRHKRFLKIHPDGNLERINFAAQDTTSYAIIKQFDNGDYVWSYVHDLQLNTLSLYLNNWPAKHISTPTLASDLNGFSLHPVSDTLMLISLKSCIYKATPHHFEQQVCYGGQTTFGLFRDHEGNTWVATKDSGLLIYKENGRLAYSLLPDKIVTWIAPDNEGGIWLTTLNDGVFYIPSISIKCIPSSGFFENRRINYLDGYDSTLYISFYQPSDVLQLSYSPDFLLSKKPVPSVKFRNQSIVTVSKDSGNVLMVSGIREGKGQNAVSLIKDGNETFLDLNQALQIQYDSGRFMLMNVYGIYTCDPLEMTTNQLIKSSDQLFICFKPDPTEDKTWFGRHDGLSVYENGKIRPLSKENSLFQHRVNRIESYKNMIVMATLGAGIVFVSGDSVWNITREDGLISDMCNSVYVDDDDFIWVSTNKGLSRVSLSDEITIVNYTGKNGLLSNEVDDVVVMDNLVWVKNDNGLSVFDKFLKNPVGTPPPIYIDQFRINNQDTIVKNGCTLNYKQNNIQIGFSALSFRSGGHILYKYRLLGSNPDWQYTYNTSLIYPKLPYGTYLFEVLGKDYKGEWSTTPASLKFTIKKPFWKLWWFTAAEILAIFSILWIILAARSKQTRLLRRSFESEQKALQAQLNPHFVFNAMASIQELLQSGKYKAAKLNLSNMANLLRRVLMNSRLTEISLEEEIDNLESYLRLEMLRFDNTLEWSITCSDDIDSSMTYIPPMLIQPFVENAIWHGLIPKGEGKIQISFYIEQNKLCCLIEDNGIGREMSKQNRGKYSHKPMGMKIVEERLELLNKNKKTSVTVEVIDKFNNQGEPEGTKVLIYFPYF